MQGCLVRKCAKAVILGARTPPACRAICECYGSNKTQPVEKEWLQAKRPEEQIIVLSDIFVSSLCPDVAFIPDGS